MVELTDVERHAIDEAIQIMRSRASKCEDRRDYDEVVRWRHAADCCIALLARDAEARGKVAVSRDVLQAFVRLVRCRWDEMELADGREAIAEAEAALKEGE